MEEPGLISKKKRRVKLTSIILSSLILLWLISTITLLPINKKIKMENRSSIKGVLQNKDGRPLADAIIMIKDGSHEFNDIASVSNEQGEFFVSNIVVPGKYVLQIQHDSNSITKEINIQSPDTTIHITF